MSKRKVVEEDYSQLWICDPCGRMYGRMVCLVSTYHKGVCSWCGKEDHVTQPRDWGYPDSPATLARKRKVVDKLTRQAQKLKMGY